MAYPNTKNKLPIARTKRGKEKVLKVMKSFSFFSGRGVFNKFRRLKTLNI